MFPVNLETLLSVSQYGILDILTIIQLLYITEKYKHNFFQIVITTASYLLLFSQLNLTL